MTVDFNVDGLRSWLDSETPGLGELITITKFPGGQSNPTYRMSGTKGQWVLRRKPFGALLPSAHAIEREYRLISALHPVGFPAPRPIALCEDQNVIGASFYIMEMVDGRNFSDGLLHGIPSEGRGPIYRCMIETLARLHSVDVESIGLQDLGRPGNYFGRQVTRWTKQYRATQTDDLPAVERLIEWLPTTMPEQQRITITHGDYRIDNLIFAQSSPQVMAVLDWELATLGDPLADLSYLLMNWVTPPMGQLGILTDGLASSGIPSIEEAVAIYQENAGSVSQPVGLASLHWYFAYNLFRLTGITQGIKRRLLDGNASNAEAATAAARVPILANLAWDQARLAGA